MYVDLNCSGIARKKEIKKGTQKESAAQTTDSEKNKSENQSNVTAGMIDEDVVCMSRARWDLSVQALLKSQLA